MKRKFPALIARSLNTILAVAMSLCLSCPVHGKSLTEMLYGKPKKDKAGVEIERSIVFDYNDEELVDVINYMASQKGVNVVMPMGSNAITSKITLKIDHPLSIDEAWDILFTCLDVAGYSLIKKSDMYSIVKNSKAVSKEVIPLYVGMKPDELPDTDERIRYIYYLTNIKVPEGADNELKAVLDKLLPDISSSQFDLRVNAVLITDKASNIKGVMKIVEALDETTYQEKLEILSLRYTDAETIAKLFTENILKTTGNDALRNRAKGKKGDANYFTEQIKIFSEPRTNQLILLGKGQAVNRVKEFIYKYIDVQMETGQSILHVYQLLYLDATTFQDVLKNIVESGMQGGTGQSTAGSVKSGIDRFFDGVIIRADQPKGGKDQQLFGSNKLIIAAKNDDWKYIKRLIEQLDKPQPQVILEVLVADLTINDIRQLGTQLRNAAALPLPGKLDFQSAQIGPVVPDSFVNASGEPNATTIASDLLGVVFPANVTPPTQSLADLTAVSQPGFPGSTLISFNDRGTGKTWGIAQILQTFSHSKILSSPHVIATNNQPATVTIGQQRLVTGETTATAAAPTIRNDFINANLTVTIKPRISSSNNVNLQVSVDVSEFLPGSNTRTTRKIITNAYVQSEDILALGGLIRLNDAESLNETPIIAKIPILGWFFKRRNATTVKTNLTVFISPTVVQPRLRGGVDEYTKDYIKLTEKYVNEAELFDSLRDPITRFFFRANPDVNYAIDEFLVTDEFKSSVIMQMPTSSAQPKRKTGEDLRSKRKRNQILAAAEQPEKTLPIPQAQAKATTASQNSSAVR